MISTFCIHCPGGGGDYWDYVHRGQTETLSHYVTNLPQLCKCYSSPVEMWLMLFGGFGHIIYRGKVVEHRFLNFSTGGP